MKTIEFDYDMKNTLLKKIDIYLRVKHEKYLEKNFARKMDYDRFSEIDILDLERVNIINKSAYDSEEMINELTNRYSNAETLREYCNCIAPSQIKLYIEDNWYVTMVHHYRYIDIIDFACLNGKCDKPLEVVNKLWNIVLEQRNKIYLSYAHEKTSYRIIKSYEKNKRIKITSEEPYKWGNEQMYLVTFTVCPEYEK